MEVSGKCTLETMVVAAMLCTLPDEKSELPQGQKKSGVPSGVGEHESHSSEMQLKYL